MFKSAPVCGFTPSGTIPTHRANYAVSRTLSMGCNPTVWDQGSRGEDASGPIHRRLARWMRHSGSLDFTRLRIPQAVPETAQAASGNVPPLPSSGVLL